MNNRDRNDSQYFNMATFIAVISMTALIALRRDDYIRHGPGLLLIPVVLCSAFLALCIPLMKYLRKISEGDSEAGYVQAANLFAVFSMVSFILVRLPEYIGSAQYFKAAVLLVACLVVIGIMIVLMVVIKSASSLAFYIPAVTFSLYTLGTIALGGNDYYFLTYLVICGFGAVYNYYVRYRNFIVLSHLVILCLVIMRIPFLGQGMSRNDVVLRWALAVYTTNLFLMLSRLSTEKSSRSARAQDTFDALMSVTPNFLVMVDEMNRVTYISKPMADLARIEDYEMAAGRPVIDLFHDINMKLVIGELVEAEGFYDGAVELLINGKKRHMKITSDRFPGNTPGRFIDMSDITPIMEARLEAEKANSAKSAFLARMSHEIRTPMNAITGMSELILREEASPAVYEYAAAVKQAGNNLVAIINDILDFSKIESGKMEILPAEYEFSSLINDAITIIRMRLREKPVYFAVNVDSAIPKKLYGDVIRVRQILLNLLSNAVKYTNKGHIMLTVALETIEAESLILKFEVADTGIGIKMQDIHKLFGDFTRVDTRANQGIEGTGLGLAISRNLCRAMGGDVTVESVYGEGSVFTAYIPQGIRDRMPFAAVTDAATKKVLVYETREIYGNSIVCSIDNLGVSCKLVAGSEDFVRALQTDRFDFIFAASFLFDEAQGEIRKQGIDTTLVLLADYGEVIVDRQALFVAMPVYAISIANILNRVEALQGYSEEASNIRFTAPEARILIVDDIKTNLDVAEGLLAPYAMQVETCLSGFEAIALARDTRYDLILMDHMMPDMNGIEATAAIRSWEESQKNGGQTGFPDKTPIIALTANAVSGMRDMFLREGFDDYISKPIELVKLDSILARWIPDRKKRRIIGGVNTGKVRADAPSFKAIPGLDRARGVAMTGGTEAGYRKVLAQFRKDAAERLSIFAAPPGEAAGELIAINAHAIKSAAGTIGAAELSAEAAILEEAGKTGDAEKINGILPRFFTHLAELVEAIGKALEEGGETDMKGEQATGISGKQEEGADAMLRSPLLALKEALEAKNMREIDRLFGELEKITGDAKDREAIDAISDMALLGEYQAAIESVNIMLHKAERHES